MSLKLEPHEVAFWREVYRDALRSRWKRSRENESLKTIAACAESIADSAVASLRSRFPAPEAVDDRWTYLQGGDVLMDGDEMWVSAERGWEPVDCVGEPLIDGMHVPMRRRVKP